MPLNRLKRLLVPQDGFFFELLQKQAAIAHACSQTLCELLKDFRNVQKKAQKIKEFEHEGDALMREIYKSLNKTFIVPIDHTDISTLASALDDIVDLIDHISTLLIAYKIKTPSPAMIQLAELAANQTHELKGAVTAINHSRTYNEVAKHCTKIKEFENKADGIYIRAIEVLFEKNQPLEVFKRKEILECLESTTDKVDKAAQYISDIVMKHS